MDKNVVDYKECKKININEAYIPCTFYKDCK